jgi:hypothetical protein
MNHRNSKKLLLIPLGIALFFAFAYAVMWLWNGLMPEIFGLPIISLWQAIGLFFLSRVFFGSFGSGGRKKHFSKSKFKNKLMDMDPDEREKFKEEWKRRCGN